MVCDVCWDELLFDGRERGLLRLTFCILSLAVNHSPYTLMPLLNSMPLVLVASMNLILHTIASKNVELLQILECEGNSLSNIVFVALKKVLEGDGKFVNLHSLRIGNALERLEVGVRTYLKQWMNEDVLTNLYSEVLFRFKKRRSVFGLNSIPFSCFSDLNHGRYMLERAAIRVSSLQTNNKGGGPLS